MWEKLAELDEDLVPVTDLARRILAIPASEATSERDVSHLGVVSRGCRLR